MLFEAAEQADCVGALALVTLWQSGSAEGGYDEYSHGRGRRYRWSDDTVQLGKPFVKFCQQQGWASFEAELTTVLETMTAATVTRNAGLLQALFVGRDKNVERIELCRRLSERSVKALAALDQQPRNRDWQWQAIDRAALLSSLVTAMTAVGAEPPLSQLLDHALACDKYDLTDAHLTAIFALESRLIKPMSRLVPAEMGRCWIAASRVCRISAWSRSSSRTPMAG